MRIVLDPGHGGMDPGAVGNGLVEKEVTLVLARLVREALQRYESVEILLTREDDVTVSLAERVRMANEVAADVFLSLHVNAFSDPRPRGFESYIHSSLADTGRTAQIRAAIHQRTAETFLRFGSPDRGPKKADFTVLRETRMPAVLTENGFLSNPEDARLLKDDRFLRAVADAHARGVAEAFGLTARTKAPSPFPDPPEAHTRPNKLYIVQIGAFRERANAERLAARARACGFEAIVKEVDVGGA
ncbi:N-acetylmuramoyl-L-alanine amidase family protein [Brockia lithotrophica]|uniref:N-acetylmuramoyl-L-alanine amidase n=1 Tax=Brockia lithotrophica TaxID=933949 RepID=A0A660L9L9_9BACL|nr:N-acetylmuramoyl-L-alanine amidase [Brockia lithotrophica]RKQ88633.1 N-acetylmuramoyl-L-alanine amidase [Brockia lithotrophica]